MCSRLDTPPDVIFHREIPKAKPHVLYISKGEIPEDHFSSSRIESDKYPSLLCCQLREIPEGWKLSKALFTSIEKGPQNSVINWDMEAWSMTMPSRRPWVAALSFQWEYRASLDLIIEFHHPFPGNSVPVFFEHPSDDRLLRELLLHHAQNPVSHTTSQVHINSGPSFYDEVFCAVVSKDFVFGVEVFVIRISKYESRKGVPQIIVS